MQTSGVSACGLTVCILALAAVAPSQGHLTTLFQSNNGGAPSGAVYFDVDVRRASGITITSIDVNTSATPGSIGTIDIYTTAGTYAGNEWSPGAWTLATSATVANMGQDQPSPAVLAAPWHLPAGQTGVAFCDQGVPARYTNGTGSNQIYSNADLTLTLGSATSSCFAGTLFSPRVANLTIHYQIGSALRVFGLDHWPIGNATLSTNAPGSLIVSNLGSSGQDGVRIESGGAQGWRMTGGGDWTTSGQRLQFRFLGTNSSGSGSLVTTCLIEGRGKDALITIDFGSSVSTVELTGRDETKRVVGRQVLPNPLVFSIQSPADLPIGWWGTNPLGQVDFCWPTKIIGYDANGLPIIGGPVNYLKVGPWYPSGTGWGKLVGVGLRANGGTTNIDGERLILGNSQLSTIGAVALNATASGVRASNMAGGGVRFDFDPSSVAGVTLGSPTGLQNGTNLHAAFEGEFRNGARGEIAAIDFDYRGAAWQMSSSPPSATAQRVDVLSGGAVVHTETVPLGVFATTNVLAPNIIILWPPAVQMAFGQPVTITMPSATTVVGDTLVHSAIPTPVASRFRAATALTLTATALASLEISDLEAAATHRYGNGMTGSGGAPYTVLNAYPYTGSTASIVATELAPTSPTVFVLGTYRLQPISLSFLGLQGGELLVDPWLSPNALADASGTARLTLLIPPNALGAELAVQVANLDPGAINPLGLTVSDGMFFTVQR